MKKRDLIIEFAIGRFDFPNAITIGTIDTFDYDKEKHVYRYRCSRSIFNTGMFSYPYTSIILWDTNIPKNKLFEKLRPYMEVEDRNDVIKIISSLDIERLR